MGRPLILGPAGPPGPFSFREADHRKNFLANALRRSLISDRC